MCHPRLTLAVTGQSIWKKKKFQKMPQKVAKSIGKYFGHYRNFIYFPHWVQQYTYLCCNLGNFYYFPLILAHWLIWLICLFRIVSMYSHIQIVHIVWLIGIKSNGNYRNFIIFTCFIRSIMCYVYSNTKLILFPHWVGLLAVNTGEIIEILIISHQLSAV